MQRFLFPSVSFFLESSYDSKDTVWVKLTVNGNKTEEISSIQKSSDKFTVADKHGVVINSYTLHPNLTDSLMVIFTPNRYNDSRKGRITFVTNDLSYSVYLKTDDYDIGTSNFKVKQYNVVKERDKPLLLKFRRINTHNYFYLFDKPALLDGNAFIKNKNEAIKFTALTDIGGDGVMDITDLKAGKYFLYLQTGKLHKIELIVKNQE